MKKLVIMLSVLCFSLFLITSELRSTFAEDSTDLNNDNTKYVSDELVSDIPKNDNIVIDDKGDENDSSHHEVEYKEPDKKEDVKLPNTQSSNNENINKDKFVENDSINSSIDESIVNNKEDNIDNPKEENIVTEIPEVSNPTITQEDALNILKNINPDLTYNYQGNENTFTVLKDKGLSGYVFLPNVDTDLGYFVDKNTSHVYFFHPSGYLELIQ